MNKNMFATISILLVIFSVSAVKAYGVEVAPDFTLTDIDGKVFSLSDYRGKVVILDFFAIECLACIDEIPHLGAIHEKFGEAVVIISISTNPVSDTVERLQSFKKQHSINWTISRDTESIYYYKYSVTFIPTLVLIDWEGNIRYRHIGPTDESILSAELTEIPEFPAAIIPLLFIILSLFTVASKRLIQSRGRSKRSDAFIMILVG